MVIQTSDLSESSTTTTGPEARTTLGLFKRQRRIAEDIKPGSLALGTRQGEDDQKNIDLQRVTPSLTHTETFIHILSHGQSKHVMALVKVL